MVRKQQEKNEGWVRHHGDIVMRSLTLIFEHFTRKTEELNYDICIVVNGECHLHTTRR